MPKERRLEYISFVKSKLDTEPLVKFAKNEISVQKSDGKNARKFYSDLLSNHPSTSTVKGHSRKESESKQKAGKYTEKQPETVNKQKLHKYFKCVEEGYVEQIQEFLDQGINVDAVDEYGWSALMCASCSGHLNVVKLLTQRSCNVEAINKKGQTALDIAVKAKRSKVVKFLQGEYSQTTYLTEKRESKPDIFYCDVCKIEVKDCSQRSHETSTVHLFNSKIVPKEQNYILPETNAGFQLMLRSGWDQDKGLGSAGQGRKYPVKTVLKRDRLGIGNKVKTGAKVTHFGPKDNKALEGGSRDRHMKISTLNKQRQSKMQRKEKAKEQSFRREFY